MSSNAASDGDDDYYGVLGVPKTANKSDVKKAYYSAAKKCHPDTNAGDPAAAKKFAALTEAYEVLSDDEKRATYDRFGKAGVNGDGMGGAGGFGGGFGGGQQMRAEDIFEAFERAFGGQGGADPFSQFRRQRGPARGRDVQVNVQLSLDQAAKGTRHTVAWRSPSDGSRKELEVDIPAGVDSGMNLRIAGKGEDGPGGRGTLFIAVSVLEHAVFERDGADVHVKVRLSLSEAILGASVKIPTLDGDVNLKVPGGTRTGDRRVMSSRGIQLPGTRQRGHQFVHFEVLIPRTPVDERHRQLVEELRQFEPSLSAEERTSREQS